MLLKYNGRNLGFKQHVPDQRPYQNIDPIIGRGRLNGEPIQLLMNSHPTPAGNESRRVSLEINETWIFRDDAALRRDALKSAAGGPVLELFTK